MADTDITINESDANQIDIKVSTADDFTITANKFDVLSGSTLEINGTLDLNGREFILDADADTSITADTDDQIDIRIAGADDFQFTANKFTAAASSGILLTKTAAASDAATSSGDFTSNNYNISHTFTLNSDYQNNAVHADFTVTSDKCTATSVVIGTSSVKCHVRCHTVADGSFKVGLENQSGGVLANDSTMILNFVIL
jgi:hypothetical protein